MSDPVRDIAQISALEEDLFTYAQLIRDYGPVSNLVTLVNEERAGLGLPPFGWVR